MSLAKWVNDLKQLHEKAKADKLSPDERQVYEAGRDQLARALVSAQHLTLKPGETPRQALRVARSLQVDIELSTGSLRTPTLDLCVGGFSVLLPSDAVPKGPVSYQLRLPGGDPMRGDATPVESKKMGSSVRVSFTFDRVAPNAYERLESVIFETALSMINV